MNREKGKIYRRMPQRTRWFVCGFLLALLIAWWNLLPSPLFQVPYSTVLLDHEGTTIGIKAADDGQIRFQARGQLPGRYVAALLIFEDKGFLFHHGVDPVALVRAGIANLRAGSIVSGGSTLSMQVIRLSRKNPPRTIWEKVKEIVLTFRLEQSYSKQEILELYAAHAPFGGNIVGLQAASLKYFNRAPEQLSWAEAALLAVLPNSPALIYPGKNNHLLKDKRDRLLGKLHRYGLMDKDTYQLAIAEPLPQQLHKPPTTAPHLLTRACIERKGEACPSYIDRHLQRQVNEIVERHTNLLCQNYIYNIAVLVAHVPSGEVRAYVGNSPPRPGSGGNDVDIIQASRSSGSILKPALYAEMLQAGFILPRTLVPDIPSRFGEYAPSNFNRDFKGAVPAAQALAQSLNIPFVHLLQRYTYLRFYDNLKELGITTLHFPADHYGLSLILGGAETSLWDLCNLYSGMASALRHYNEEDGLYFAGEYDRLKLWATSDTTSPTPIPPTQAPLKASAIWQTFQALENVERPEMESGWKNFVSAMNLSWKTGTSFGFRDAWAVGVNPEYVIGVWVGNADGEGRPGLTGVRAAAPILFEVANLLPCREQFYPPVEEMQLASICKKSGYRASLFCEETDTAYICRAGMQTKPCPYHRLVHVDSTETWRVTAACEPTSQIKTVSWFVLPPVQEWYYCRNHSDYRKLPPFRPDCHAMEEDAMEMVYPPRGTKVFLPRDFGGEIGKTVFEAVHRSPDAIIYWHVDDQYLGMTQHIHQMELHLKEGRHKLTLVDGTGNTLTQSFQVVGKDSP